MEEKEVAIPAETEIEKIVEIINGVNESNRFKAAKELAGKEAGDVNTGDKIEDKNANGVEAKIKKFKTRSGVDVEAIDYSFINQIDIQLVNPDDILSKPKPNWCPDINEKKFAGYKDANFVFDYVKLDDDRILLAVNGFEKGNMFRNYIDEKITNKHLETALINKKYTSKQLKRPNPYGTPDKGYFIKLGEDIYEYGTDKESWSKDQELLNDNVKSNYAVVSLDQLVATQDYYQKKRKAEIAQDKNDKIEENAKKVLTWDEATIKRYDTFSYEKRLSQKQRDKWTKEEWEALPIADKVKEISDMKHPVFKVAGHRISQLDDNKMMSSNFKMYKKYVDSTYLTPEDKKERFYNSTVDPCAIEYKEIREALQWKKIDLKVQREENHATYDKAFETSFGESNTVDNLVKSHGVKIKAQNGKKLTPIQIEQISSSLDDVYQSFGDRSEMAKKVGMKISHSGEKLMFARKALGIFIPSTKTIGVSNRSQEGKFGFTLAHEFAHFMDNHLGQGKRHFASDDYNSTAGKIAKVFRANMNKKSDSDYINRSCESFARAFEQYHAMKHGGDDVVKYQDKGISYHEDDNHVNKEKFNTLIKPLIESFLKENNDLLKSAFNTIFG